MRGHTRKQWLLIILSKQTALDSMLDLLDNMGNTKTMNRNVKYGHLNKAVYEANNKCSGRKNTEYFWTY
jgi:hypothetical protein